MSAPENDLSEADQHLMTGAHEAYWRGKFAPWVLQFPPVMVAESIVTTDFVTP